MGNQHLERLDGLAPLIRQPVARLMSLCEQRLSRKLMVVRGWSSAQDQLALYKKGRIYDAASGLWLVTDSLSLVTNSLPGLSAHNVITKDGQAYAMAVDLIPLIEGSGGDADWNVDDDFWDDLYELSWKCGLDPLGDPTGAYLKADKGHFEEPGWKLKLEGLGAFQPVATITGGV